MVKSSRRQDLIDTAIALFNEHGFHATGIEMILGKARMSKKTLYTYFRSKDELVLAALRHYDSLFRNSFMAKVEKASSSAEGRLLAIFDVAEEWFLQKDFFGCIFISATSEYSDRSSAIRQTSYEFKRLMHRYIRDLCSQLEIPNPDELANELSLLFEGATVTAQISGSPEAARVAGKMAKRLVADAMAQQTKVRDSSNMAANV